MKFNYFNFLTLIILSITINVKAEFPTIKLDVENEDTDVVIITALFTKINYIIMEMDNITKNVNELTQSLREQKEANNKLMEMNQEVIQNLRDQNKEIKELFVQQDAKANINLMEMKREVLQNLSELKIQEARNRQTQRDEIKELFLQQDVKTNNKSMEMKHEVLQNLSELKIEETSNQRNQKEEIKELFLQQDVKTKNNLIEIKQEVFQKYDIQENLIKASSKYIESVNTTLQKLLKFEPMKQNQNWIVILRRQDGSENFNRYWTDYKNGFGNPNGEFFIGLERLHMMTTYGAPQELLIILGDFDNQTRYAKYESFAIGNETEKYQIKKISGYSGDAGDSFSNHRNDKFSTPDQDNDTFKYSHCARDFKGGWWYSDCYTVNLAGPYFHPPNSNMSDRKGIHWNQWHGYNYSLKFVEMIIRPV